MRVTAIDIAECCLPLPRPILLGPVTITTRDVIALRMRTDAGLEGFALGYSRGTPLFRMLAHLAPRFLGACPHDRNNVMLAAQRALTNSGASLVRPFSLLEIGLSDLSAKDARLSLGKLLGGHRAHIPVMAVAGYYLSERTDDDVLREVSGLLDEGYRRVKVMLRGDDPARDAQMIALLMPRAEGRLAVDAHWSWTTVPEAVNAFRAMDSMGLLFLEDPFGPGHWPLLARLQPLLRTPLAAGEDTLDIATLVEISRSASFLRVDATTCGGIGPAVAALRAAAVTGCEILPHVHAAIHAQLAAAYQEIAFVEHIPQDCGADPLHLIQSRPTRIENGKLLVDEEPGAGTALDWEAVARHAVQTQVIEGRP